MAQKTTQTVTQNPLPPEQVEYNQQIIDANKAWLETAAQVTPTIVARILEGGADEGFARDIFRSSGLFSDEASAIAQGVQYIPPGGTAPTARTAGLAPVQNRGIGGNNPPPGALPGATGLAANPQQFPALADAFAQDRAEVEQAGLGGLSTEQATAIAQGIGAKISAAGGIPDPALMNQYRIALNAATQNSPQGGGVGLAPQGTPQSGPQGGVGLAPQSVQSFQSPPFDPTADFGLIANAADTAITAGQKDIDRFFGDAMKVLQDQATARGMRFRDTPILDRGGQIATDVLRQKEDLAEGIRAQQASLNLSHPLEKYSILSNVGVNEGRLALDNRSLAQQADQFTRELGLRNRTLGADVAQRGIENRLASATSLLDRYNFGVNSGLNLINVTRPNQPQFPDSGSTSVTKGSGSSTSSLLGGAGALLSGVGAITSGGGLLKGASKLFSSRELKDIHEDALPDKALDGVMQTPVSKWTYKGDDTMHIGPMAEDFQQAFGVGDGKTISIIDAIGVLFAAVQELGRKADGHQQRA